MNKTILFLSGIFFSLMLVGLVSAVDVGYVVKNPGSLDSNEVAVKNVLVNEGYDVNVLDDISFDAGLYDVILVSESVDDIDGVFDNRYFKTFFMSNSAAKKAGLSSSSGLTSGTKIYLNDNQNIITEDFLLGDLSVYSSQEKIDYVHGCKAVNSKSLADKSGNRSVLLILDKDSLLLDGSCTKRDVEIYERNLFFGLTEAGKWNLDAEKLFLNSFKWLLDSSDNDGDGYSSIEDCDDEDASVHPYADELCNNVDDNCDGNIDEGFDIGNTCSVGVGECVNYGNLVCSIDGLGSECDAVPGTPGEEIDDGLDNDCDGQIDEGEDTCSSLNGYVCSSSQICDEDWLDADDSDRCCSVVCSNGIEFSNIEREENKTDDIEVNIKSPDEGSEINIGEKINTRIEIKNNADKDLEFDVDVYLYDLTNDEIVEDFSYKIDVDESESITSNNEIEFPEDVDKNNDYAIFVEILDEDGEYYNEDYVIIDLVRAENKVIINSFSINPENVHCGDYIELRVRVKNVGTKEQGGYIKIKNSDLKIDEKSENIKLEEYGEDDSEREIFRIKVPENTKSGEHIITANAIFNGRSYSLDKKINVICESFGDKNSEIQKVELGNNDLKPVKVPKDNSFNFKWFFLIWGVGAFVGLMIIFLFLWFKDSKLILHLS